MFSRSNHHHERQRGGSLPPKAGDRRQRSEESTPDKSESEDAHNKKSPHTRRIVKRGRTTHCLDEDTPLFLPSSPNHGSLAEPQGSTLHPSIALQAVVLEQTRHLEALLDSVLATLVIIQTASTSPVNLSDHSCHALSVLNKLVQTASQSATLATCSPPAAHLQLQPSPLQT